MLGCRAISPTASVSGASGSSSTSRYVPITMIAASDSWLARKRRNRIDGVSAAWRSSMTMSIGTRLCGAPQERGHRVEELEPGGLRLDVSQRRQVGIELAQVGHHLGDVLGTGAELPAQDVLIGPADEHAQSLHPRPVRRRAGVVPASSHEHPHPVVASSRRELIGQAALADARLAEQQEQAPLPGGRVTEPSEKLAQLTVAADEDGNGLWLGSRCDRPTSLLDAEHTWPGVTVGSRRVHIRSALRRSPFLPAARPCAPHLTPPG